MIGNGLYMAYSDDTLSSVVKENAECWSKVAEKGAMLWMIRLYIGEREEGKEIERGREREGEREEEGKEIKRRREGGREGDRE